MTQRVHDMPFGASVSDEGVLFSLHAPSVERVDLLLAGREPVAMPHASDGFARLLVRDAKAGQDYAFRLPDGLIVPDPASRWQAPGSEGRSRVIDPRAYAWRDADWRGRPWSEAVLYEAHIGTATREGTYKAFADQLDRLADLGVTAIEIMPIADCPGAHNWGYDGVLPFAPNNAYGAPDELKALIDRAHALRLMVLIDVVYNHFGPTGNYLHAYAETFFTERHQTPWGAALNYDDVGREAMRAFVVHNARYWIEEFHADGLRLDAVHAIRDDSERHILAEIAQSVREGAPGREIHLVLENDANEAKWLAREADGLRPKLYTAQWNDDAHHCWHALLTGERDGYYADFAPRAPARLARSLAEGFVYQGDPSTFREGELRGEPSAHLHPTAFVDFLQNHDQVGNRAFGERIDMLADPRRTALARAIVLLSPHVPLLFMGEEWGSRTPFLYFVDFGHDPDLSNAVREGRRREFQGFERFAATSTDDIPDPTASSTFTRSVLDLDEASRAPHADILAQTRRLLEIRRLEVAPLLSSRFIDARWSVDDRAATLDVGWRFEAGFLRVGLNLGVGPATMNLEDDEETIFESDGAQIDEGEARLSPWSGFVARGGARG